MSEEMTPRERRFADAAAYKLVAGHVDTDDHAAVRACLLRCVAGRLLWRAWRKRDNAARWTPRQLQLLGSGP